MKSESLGCPKKRRETFLTQQKKVPLTNQSLENNTAPGDAGTEQYRDKTLSMRCVSVIRVANNGRSTDNVRPDRGLDRSNSGLAGHFDRSFLDTNTLFSIQLSLNAL